MRSGNCPTLLKTTVLTDHSGVTLMASLPTNPSRNVTANIPIVITRCPLFVHKTSVAVIFSHFRLLLWNRWMEFNESWKEPRSTRQLSILCFSGRSEKHDCRPASDWLRHFWLVLWNRWTECNHTWQDTTESTTSASYVDLLLSIGRDSQLHTSI